MAFFDKIKKWFKAAPPAPVDDFSSQPLPDVDSLKAAGERISEETKAASAAPVEETRNPKSLREAFLEELRSIPTTRDSGISTGGDRTRHDILDELKKISPPKKENPPK